MTSPIRLFAAVALVMTAFAANSILNRAAVGTGGIGPLDFAAIRTASGAIALAALVFASNGSWRMSARRLIVGALSLLVYMLGFSLAYLRLDAGAGALILFGGVQITMFAGALAGGERPRPARWAGAALALTGLALMVWPAAGARVDPLSAGLMALAAAGWGVYSLNGRHVADPLAATAANFLLAAPLCVAAALFATGAEGLGAATGRGIVLAVISGVVTSGLGYALWYSVLPRLAASTAALAQLTVPVIAFAGGVAILGETPQLATVFAAVLVLGGVAFGTMAGSRQR